MSDEIRHPVFARVYARISVAAEGRGQAEHREELLDGLAGRVIEVGAGNGLNFSHYPPGVTEVVAVEPEAFLRKLAGEAAERARVPVTVIAGVPGGELRFYEHVRAPTPLAARLQRVADVLWPRIAGGCHTSRDTVGAVREAGFVIEECRGFSFRPSLLAFPTSPHVLGRARKA